jgi:oligopeptide/dipeptide ABC transporter ATP-binding protein
MLDLREKTGTSIILITHDLGVISDMADRVAVMYAGQIVEQCKVDVLFEKPYHPYSQGLIGSIPVLGKVADRLEVIPGNVPNLVNLPEGCRFAPRCRLCEQYKLDICAKQYPPLVEIQPGHLVRCWLYQSTDGHKAPIQL